MTEGFRMDTAAALQGMLRAVEQRRGGCTGLHELAGLFHCTHGDPARMSQWLRWMVHRLALHRAWLLEAGADGRVWRAACSDDAPTPLQGWRLPDLGAAPEGQALIECSDDASNTLPRSQVLRQALADDRAAWVCAGVVKARADALAALVVLRGGRPQAAADLRDDLTRLLWHVYLQCRARPVGTAAAVPHQQRLPANEGGALSPMGTRLTPAEVEVLRRVLQGQTAKIIASARGASVNTVRSQIMAVLGKTGHHNQKSLMAAFGNSAFGDSLAPHADGTPGRTAR